MEKQQAIAMLAVLVALVTVFGLIAQAVGSGKIDLQGMRFNIHSEIESSPSPMSQNGRETKTFTHSSKFFSFEHPADWTVTEDNDASMRRVTAMSPNGFRLEASYGQSGVGGRCDDNANTTVSMEPISVMGQKGNIFFAGDKGKNLISSAYILQSDTPCNNIPFISVPGFMGMPAGNAKVEFFYTDRRTVPADQFKGQDFQDAKHIIQSVSTGL